jgi:hypothetical protein
MLNPEQQQQLIITIANAIDNGALGMIALRTGKDGAVVLYINTKEDVAKYAKHFVDKFSGGN